MYNTTREVETLVKLGFEEREARVYLTVLRLGDSTASVIAEDVNIDRTTTYNLLNRLIKKGSVSYVIKDNVKVFSAASPKQFAEQLKEKEVDLQEIMPQLLKLANSEKQKTELEMFKGKEAIKYITEMVLHDKKDYMFIGAGHAFCQIAPIWIRKLVIKAHEIGLRGKLICEEGFGDSDVDIIGKNETYRIASKEFSSTTTLVWGNKTAFFILEEPYNTILIENKEIADRHRLYFNYLWIQSKAPSPEHIRKTRIND
jgi:sugar-specific transcriptional regulator TrmB